MSYRNTFFEDTLIIKSLDKNGKLFDRITRIEGIASETQCNIILDVNSEIYKVSKDKLYSILLTKSLFPDGSTPTQFNYEMYLKKNSLLDSYEYVMNGKVFKLTEENEGKISVHISFGGLILGITGDPKHVSSLNLDERLYLLMKKID
jgi:DNA-directed RNA polymerase I, II, and III subunit RPABC3